MTVLELLQLMYAAYNAVTGEEGTMPEDVEVQTQTLIEVRDSIELLVEQNAKMYMTMGLMQVVLFVTCTITIVRGWLFNGSRN